MLSKPRTKPGPHGGLVRLYEVTYRDQSGDPTMKQRLWAYNLEHLAEKFYDAPDADGWVLVSAQTVGETGIMGRRPVHYFAS